MSSIKVTYNGETKKVRKPNSFVELVKAVNMTFSELPNVFKFTYVDEEGDEITVTSEEDFQEAVGFMGAKLKLSIEPRQDMSYNMSQM